MLFDYLGDKNGLHVLIATTCYDKPAPDYSFAVTVAARELAECEIQASYLLLPGRCHVDDARNTVMRVFLRETTCTDLIFIDADVAFTTENLLALLDCKRPGIVGGVYPHRGATSMGVPVRTIPGAALNDDGTMEVDGLPTGFMRIPRDAAELLWRAAPKYYTDNGKETAQIFSRTIDIEGFRIGGDIGMCLKYRSLGGHVWALYEERLGHSGTIMRTGSMGSEIRRIARVSLEHITERLKAGEIDLRHFDEAFDAWGNVWAATSDVLGVAATMAKAADRPILEMGCGLTTLLMAAASNQTVHAIEHDRAFAEEVDGWAKKLGLDNIHIYVVDWHDGWYRIPLGILPDDFSFAVIDGPPLYMGSRRETFFDAFPHVETVIMDDAERVSAPDGYLTIHTNDRLRVVRRAAV